jgi:hypothetical protein
MHAPDATTGYDFSTLEEMLAWRDGQQSRRRSECDGVLSGSRGNA